MSLRQRHIKKGFRSGDAVTEGGAAAGGAQALATVAVGLKPGEMQKLERQLFGSRIKDYSKSRYGFKHKSSQLFAADCCTAEAGGGVLREQAGGSSHKRCRGAAGTRFWSSGSRTAHMQWT
jgi:hypothetical protein